MSNDGRVYTTEYDVVVVGGGNAGFSAAHAARERGASVLVVEKSDEAEAGGNSFYTAGAFRVSHAGLEALAPYFDDATGAKLTDTVLPPYSAQDFEHDLARVTGGRGDAAMARLVARESATVVPWLAGKGFSWRLMYERQSYVSDGKWVFFGGLALSPVGGGKGLVRQHTKAAMQSGIDIVYGTALQDVHVEKEAVQGIQVRDASGSIRDIRAGAVVLAAGGFEANEHLRAQYLGSGWSKAYVRGTPLNTGEVLQLALRLGATPHGDWTSCHSVAWDVGGPRGGGDRELTNQLTRQSYPLGIVVNIEGKRFLDEGRDFRNYTYAEYGGRILEQPEGRAFQIFDAKTRPLLRTEEYDSPDVTQFEAGTLEELAERMGIDVDAFVTTVRDYNSNIVQMPFDPAVKDGRASSVTPPKSNWALEIDSAPYYAFAVTCGITFTFGGVKVDESGRVLADDQRPIPGLYAAGEIVGGLFSGNYPGGSGLTAGTVYGRLAGHHAAATVESLRERRVR